VSLKTVTSVAETPSNFTAVTPVKPVPVQVTSVPPSTVPLVGVRLVKVAMENVPTSTVFVPPLSQKTAVPLVLSQHPLNHEPANVVSSAVHVAPLSVE